MAARATVRNPNRIPTESRHPMRVRGSGVAVAELRETYIVDACSRSRACRRRGSTDRRARQGWRCGRRPARGDMHNEPQRHGLRGRRHPCALPARHALARVAPPPWPSSPGTITLRRIEHHRYRHRTGDVGGGAEHVGDGVDAEEDSDPFRRKPTARSAGAGRHRRKCPVHHRARELADRAGLLLRPAGRRRQGKRRPAPRRCLTAANPCCPASCGGCRQRIDERRNLTEALNPNYLHSQLSKQVLLYPVMHSQKIVQSQSVAP